MTACVHRSLSCKRISDSARFSRSRSLVFQRLLMPPLCGLQRPQARRFFFSRFRMGEVYQDGVNSGFCRAVGATRHSSADERHGRPAKG